MSVNDDAVCVPTEILPWCTLFVRFFPHFVVFRRNFRVSLKVSLTRELFLWLIHATKFFFVVFCDRQLSEGKRKSRVKQLGVVVDK